MPLDDSNLRGLMGKAEVEEAPVPGGGRVRLGPFLRIVGWIVSLGLVLVVVGFFVARHSVHKALVDSLPQIEGSLAVPGLGASVTVMRDAQGVPHIRAGSVEDLVFAQGYVTAQDRLWQMDALRRHSAGELAQVLGAGMVDHDRAQRTLQVGAAAERAMAVLPADQRHWLDVYARGVNASMEAQRGHLPLEFRLLRYQPAPWTAKDSVLVGLAVFQDLTNTFPIKLGRETLTAKLGPELAADLYPVGSWRDHPPDQPLVDLTIPQPEFVDIPLDESQSRLARPAPPANSVEDLEAVERAMSLFHPACGECVAGSNGWAVAGSRTASGKPLLANDMHLTATVPGMWYEADLEAGGFHVAGVTVPGTPFVIVGHNDHVAWGVTNVGADVQDLYIEHTRGAGTGAEFQSANGEWRPVGHHAEVIHVRGGADVTLDVQTTRHGEAETPILSGLFPAEKRSLSLRWTIYDPANVTFPFFAVNSAHDWVSMQAAFSGFGGPVQNLMYADDQGHIGYHAIGRIPIRGEAPDLKAAPVPVDPSNPPPPEVSPLSPVPTDASASDAAAHEWSGYIPFDEMPQALDPPNGILATANSRVTREGYPYAITLNWASAYRAERIYKVLQGRHGLVAADMLALENDVHSELDLVLAQRLTYSIDHATGRLKDDKELRQAADILRTWNGNVDANAAAPAILSAARAVFWPMLLMPKLGGVVAPPVAGTSTAAQANGAAAGASKDDWRLYSWGQRDYVEEWMVMHTPARWLPPQYATWEDFLAAVVERGLREAHAPRDLAKWQEGQANPIDLEHPVFSRSPLLQRLMGVKVGTGRQPISGDSDTIRQVRRLLVPSERFTADLGDPGNDTLNVVLGQSGNPASPWFMDQFAHWLGGTTYPMAPVGTGHTLVLHP